MTSAVTLATIVNEQEEIDSNELNKRQENSKPSILKNKKQKQTFSTPIVEQELRADDVKEYRLWSLGSLITCFFLIGPIVAFYYSRRLRQMKIDGELTRAQSWSFRVYNILAISNIIGVVVWVAIIFVIGALFVFGALYS